MIFNKKMIMCFSICLLVFNKQSLASAPVDVDSNSLASALELASVVEKQVESDKKKNEAVNKIGRAFKAHQAKSKLAKLKKDQSLVAKKILEDLYSRNSLTYFQVKQYCDLMEDFGNKPGFYKFQERLETMQTFLKQSDPTTEKTYNRFKY